MVGRYAVVVFFKKVKMYVGSGRSGDCLVWGNFWERNGRKKNVPVDADHFGYRGFAKGLVMQRNEDDFFLQAFVDAVIVTLFKCLKMGFIVGVEQFKAG